MNRNLAIAVLILAILGGIAAFVFLPGQEPVPEVAQLQAPPPQPVVVETPQMVETPPSPTPLPKLSESDQFFVDALTSIVRLKYLTSFFRTDRIIGNFVATIDNLPTKRAPMKVMPVERAAGTLLVNKSDEEIFISEQNSARYKRYMNFADAVDAQELVALYIRLYPLFQQAYEELGYPDKHFNDRLLVALDDMLDAPNITEPVKVMQPNVFYLYADADLEERSIGQRILMRIGSRNEQKLKSKLRAIKQELLRHLRGKKIEQVR